MRYALGADISWYPQMLAGCFVFRSREGREQNLLTTLKKFGINSIRLRTWVEPSEDPHAGHCSREETLALARLCREAGFRIMIDFHYGDTWCDGSHQPMPRAWKGLDREALEKRYAERYDRYRAAADCVIPNNGTPDDAVRRILSSEAGQ